jgi:UPF0176 protein
VAEIELKSVRSFAWIAGGAMASVARAKIIFILVAKDYSNAGILDEAVYVVVTFYRFVALPDYRDWVAPIRDKCMELGIKGTVLLAREGINSTISGEQGAIDALFAWFDEEPRMQGLERKVSYCDYQPFRKVKVKAKTEIVRMRAPEANPAEAVGAYVEPENWNQVLQDPNTIVIDVRNDYETSVGTFEGALDPQTGEFREFPEFVSRQLIDKERPVAMYCTGGIRCEKASSYMVKQGFKKVMQLKGGILNYLERVPQEQSLWKGECFIFDDRRALDHNLRPGADSANSTVDPSGFH